MREFEGRWIHFTARGHRNIRALHKTTLELTVEQSLTPRGDCIIGVNSEIAGAQLPIWFKRIVRSNDSMIVMVLCTNSICDSIVGRGDPRLELSDPKRIIVRKSGYTDDKTIMIHSSKSAGDIRRDLIKELKRGSLLHIYLGAIKTFEE